MRNPTKTWFFAALVAAMVTAVNAQGTGGKVGLSRAASSGGLSQSEISVGRSNVANTEPASDASPPALPPTPPQNYQEGGGNSAGPVSGLKKPY
jgi:hypothetical protein